MGAQGGPMGRWFRRWRGADAGPEFWVDLASGEVQQGRQGLGANRMGPYPTREAAQHAFDTARARNEAWDEEDRRWNDDEADDGPAAS